MANINQNLTEDQQEQLPAQNGFPHVKPQLPINNARGGTPAKKPGSRGGSPSEFGRPSNRPSGKPGGQPGQKPKAGMPAANANTNAGHMLPDAEDFDPKAEVDKYASHRDVTPEVAGGGVQIIGGLTMPEQSDDESSEDGEDSEDNQENDDEVSAEKTPKTSAKKKAAKV